MLKTNKELIYPDKTFLTCEERYHYDAKNQKEIVSRIRADGTIIFVNNTFCQFFGKTRRELLGAKWHPHAVPEDIPMIDEKLRRLSPANPVTVVENRVVSGSGKVCWMRFIKGGFFDNDHRLVEMQSVGHDVTRYKQLESALKSANTESHIFTQLFNNTTDLILVLDREGIFRFVNSNYLRYHGVSHSAVVGRTVRQLLGDDMYEQLVQPRLARALAGENVQYEDWFSYTSVGRRCMEVHYVPLRHDGLEGFIGVILRDITKRKLTEQELLDRQRTINNMALELSIAEERERCRIAGELHDQVVPKLLLAKMRFDSLSAGLHSGEFGNNLESIDTLINQTIQDIRTLTFQLRPPILANEGLEAALKWLAEEFSEDYDLRVKIVDDKSKKPLKYDIRSAIFQIVRELLLNVAKHARTQDAVITMKREASKIVIMVEDNGIGFDASMSSFNNPQSGGFGIFNTKMKIEYLGGEMIINSAPGSGTRILIKAPLETHSTDEERIS